MELRVSKHENWIRDPLLKVRPRKPADRMMLLVKVEWPKGMRRLRGLLKERKK